MRRSVWVFILSLAAFSLLVNVFITRFMEGVVPHDASAFRFPHFEEVEMCFHKTNAEVLPTVSSMMILERRYANTWLVKAALLNSPKGDFIQAGVAGGGGAALIQSVLDCLHLPTKLFLADSWEGLPPPNKTLFPDVDTQFKGGEFHVGKEAFLVEMSRWATFWNSSNALTMESPTVLKGLFQDTLSRLPPSQKFSFVNCDGDMYSSTYDCIDNLYPRLNCGGYIYFDDYWAFSECRKAVEDYFGNHAELAATRQDSMRSVRQKGKMGQFDKTSDLKKGVSYEAVFWKKSCID